MLYQEQTYIVPRPKSYEDAVSIASQSIHRLQDIPTSKIVFSTKDLEICEGRLSVISRLAWPTVQTRISTLVITQEPAGREEPVPVYSPPSYSAEINAPVFDPNQTNFQRLAHLSSVARHSEPVLPIQLTVLTPSGKRLKIFARLSDTVLALKRKIQLLEPIEPSHQCLSFAQSLLYDGSFLGGV